MLMALEETPVARRNKTPAGSERTDMMSLLPWAVGIGLAGLCFAVLSRLAGREPATHTLVTVGQYALPLFCIAGAWLSSRRRKKQASLSMSSTTSAPGIEGMNWREFEFLVGEAFRRQGYQVVETGGRAAKDGADLVLRKDRETFLVHCKE